MYRDRLAGIPAIATGGQRAAMLAPMSAIGGRGQELTREGKHQPTKTLPLGTDLSSRRASARREWFLPRALGPGLDPNADVPYKFSTTLQRRPF